MARAALRWSVRDLAQRASIGYGTVVRFEGGKPANSATLQVIRQAFETAGVRFEGRGVFPPEEASAAAEEQQATEASAASMLARKEGLRPSKRKGK